MDDLNKKFPRRSLYVYIENPSFLGNISVKGQEMADAIHDKRGSLSFLQILHPWERLPPQPIWRRFNVRRNSTLGNSYALRRRTTAALLPAQIGRISFWSTPLASLESRPPLKKNGVLATLPGNAPLLQSVKRQRNLSEQRRRSGESPQAFTSPLWRPQGMQELSTGLMQRSCYLAQKISALPGVKLPFRNGICFKEFVVNFDGTNKRVAQINKVLLDRGIFGGHDLSGDFPQLGRRPLFRYRGAYASGFRSACFRTLADSCVDWRMTLWM